MAVAISTKEFNECNSREKLHARLVQSLSVAEQAIPQTSIRQLSLDSPNSLQLQLCTAEVRSKPYNATAVVQRPRQCMAVGQLQAQVVIKRKEICYT